MRDRSEVLFAPIDVVLASGTASQPDLLLVREENRSILQDVVRGAPDLVAEVLSPSTARRDKDVKQQVLRHVVREVARKVARAAGDPSLWSRAAPAP